MRKFRYGMIKVIYLLFYIDKQIIAVYNDDITYNIMKERCGRKSMGAQDKMKEKILKTPTSKDIEPKELQSFLNYYGFKLKRTTGSHYIYEYPTESRTFMLNIPMHSPVKPAYIDMIRDILCELEG